jgi:hypothetical protein
MIQASEWRAGNYLLQKIHSRIVTTRCSFQHFDLMAKGEVKDLFPVILRAELFEKAGFIENKSYPLLPDAREFKLVLPVIGTQKNEIAGYIKNNKECFARATVNSLPVSNNVFHLHQLQNLYYALTGEELLVDL